MPKPRIKYEITAEDKTRRQIDNIERKLKRAAKIGAGALATASVAAAAGILTLSTRAAQAADNIGKLSIQLGIGAKELSEYQFIAGQTGVKFDTFTMALQRSTRRVAEAAQGTGEAKDAIRELGIDAQKLNQLDPSAQFEVLAQQMNKVTNEADQVRLAFKLFDSEGVRLLRTIKETGGNFDELRARSRQLGATIDEDLTKKAADVNDAWAETNTALAGVGNSLLHSFAPAIVTAANKVTEFINRARLLAEDLGLLDRRLNQLSLNELNQQLEENNKRIKELGQEMQNAFFSIGKAVAATRLVALKEENAEIQKQIAGVKNLGTAEQDRAAALKAAAVVGEVGGESPLQKQRDAEFERYLETLRSEEQALTDSYARRIQIIDENTTAGSDFNAELKKQEYDRLEKLLTAHQAKLGNIQAQGVIARRKFEELNARQRTKTVIGEIASLTAGVAQENKTLFNINKVAGIANAIISAHEGISKTLGAYPYPINVGLAALHAGVAFAQVNAIRNTSFGGGGTGTTPSLAGSVPVINDIPVETAPVAEDGLGPAQANNVISISFDRGITDTEAVRQFIEEDLSEALRDGAGLDVRIVAK